MNNQNINKRTLEFNINIEINNYLTSFNFNCTHKTGLIKQYIFNLLSLVLLVVLSTPSFLSLCIITLTSTSLFSLIVLLMSSKLNFFMPYLFHNFAYLSNEPSPINFTIFNIHYRNGKVYIVFHSIKYIIHYNICKVISKMQSMKMGLLKGLVIALEIMEDKELNKDKIIGVLELIICEELKSER